MKIAFFNGNMERSGGTERVLSIIANGLIRRGYDVIIFSLTGKGPSFFELDKSIKVHWIGSRGLQTNIISNLKKLTKLMKEEKPDFLVDVDIILGFYSVLLKARFPKTHWISWEHFNYFTKFSVNHNLRKVARFIVSRFSECLVVLSNEDKGYYQSNMRLKCRIERIYNPTSFENVSDGPVNEDPTSALTEPMAGADKKKVALAVGRLTRIKGYDMLLKSWKPVEKRHPDWVLRIVGDGEEREKLEREAVTLGLKNVEFTGRVENIADYYKNAGFLVLSSRNEGFVMVLLEAMAFSLPAVAFACKAGVKEVVEDGVNGYLVPEGDIRAFAKKMDRMISNDDRRQLMGQNAGIMIKRFKLDNILDEWEKLFAGLMQTNVL